MTWRGHGLICMFSLLLCQTEIDVPSTANEAAFKVDVLNIPVCCDCVLARSWGSVWGPHRPLRVNTRQLGSKKRVLIRGSAVCRPFIYSPLQLAIWREELRNVPEQPLCGCWPFLLSYPSPPLEPPSRKEAVVVKHSASFPCTSSVGSLWKNKDRSGFGHCSIYPSACLGYLPKAHNIYFEFFLHMCSTSVKNLTF